MSFDINDIIDKIKYDPNSVKKNYDGKTDIYYAKVSYRYAYVKRILCVLLVLSIAALILSGSLSYNKLYYLAKDIRLAGEYVSSVHDTISYNVGSSQSFALYRGGLAVASRERLELFSASGKELLSSDHSCGNPVLVPSSRYILLYDAGGSRFSLYNSFSKLRDGELEQTVYGADLADNGTFALMTSSEDHLSTVSVYGIDGKKYDYNYSSARAVAVSLSKNGKRLAVALADTSGATLGCEIRVYSIGKSEYESEKLSFSGIPYAIKIFDNGNICAVGARGVNIFSEKMRRIGEYLSDREIYLYSFGEDNIVLAHLSEDASCTELTVINRYGKAEKSIESSQRVLDIKISEGYLFLKKLGSLERVGLLFGDSVQKELIASNLSIIACDKDTLLVCTESYAKFLTFEK